MTPDQRPTAAMSEEKPRAIRRWLLAIALLHWLIFIILLLQGLSKLARDRTPPGAARPYVAAPLHDGSTAPRRR